jgi:hypothetical protein
MNNLIVAFAQSKSGKRYLLGVFDDKAKLKKAYNNFISNVGGEVSLVTTELNESGLFEL